MAYITVGSKFTPFTYEERIKPIVDYNTRIEQSSDQYLEQLDDLVTVGGLLPQDSKLYQQYSSLKNEIETARDKLYSEGLTSSTKKDINSLRVKTKEFKSLATNAYNQYITEKKRRQSIEDNLGVNNVEWATPNISIDSYIPTKTVDSEGNEKIKTSSVDTSFTNLNELTKNAQTLAAQVSSTTTHRGSVLDNTSLPGFTTDSYFNGLTLEEIDTNSDNLNPELKKFYEKYGKTEKSKRAIQEGFILGNKYEEKRDRISNPYYGYTKEGVKALNEAKNLEAENAKTVASNTKSSLAAGYTLDQLNKSGFPKEGFNNTEDVKYNSYYIRVDKKGNITSIPKDSLENGAQFLTPESYEKLSDEAKTEILRQAKILLNDPNYIITNNGVTNIDQLLKVARIKFKKDGKAILLSIEPLTTKVQIPKTNSLENIGNYMPTSEDAQ